MPIIISLLHAKDFIISCPKKLNFLLLFSYPSWALFSYFWTFFFYYSLKLKSSKIGQKIKKKTSQLEIFKKKKTVRIQLMKSDKGLILMKHAFHFYSLNKINNFCHLQTVFLYPGFCTFLFDAVLMLFPILWIIKRDVKWSIYYLLFRYKNCRGFLEFLGKKFR
jgi:hypothetical protein